jgi:drug/metabolite transporter (DMT)-like permease
MPWIADLVLLAAIWGGSFLLMQMGAAAFGPLATAFLRVLLAAALLLALLAWRRQLPVLRAHLRHALTVGSLNSGLPFALFGYALLSLPSGLTSILNATTPLWGALVAALWLGDRLSAPRVAGLLIGLGGVVILCWDRARSGTSGAALPVLACLGATLCYGIAASYTKRFLTGVPPLVTATGSQVGATLALALPAALWAPPLTGPAAPGLRAWLAVLAVAVLCTALAYVLYFRLIQNAGPQRALTVTFLVPAFGLAYGSVLAGEALTLRMLAGGLTVIAGTALSLGLFKRRPA